MSICTSDQEFAFLCKAVYESLGLRLEGYRGKQLERRLGFFRQRHRLADNTQLAQRLRNDTELSQAFADFLTINVTEFFRNSERFATLRDKHLPRLLQERSPLRIWSAGCSIGSEIYSVAMFLAEMTPGVKHDFLGTDIDRGSLQRAQQALYTEHEIKDVPRDLRQRYFTAAADGKFAVNSELKRHVRFRHHDLLRDAYPQDMDLIMCRNVVIYFTDDSKNHLHGELAKSLRYGGLLFIGATESIFGAKKLNLRYLEPCFYQGEVKTKDKT